jgi:hypothetical protein
MSPIEYFSKILRIEPGALEDFTRLLEEKTGVRNVLQSLQGQNEERLKTAMDRMGIQPQSSAADALKGIDAWVGETEESLLAALGMAGAPATPEEFSQAGALFCNSAAALSGNQSGFFLKIEKARQVLEKYPPPVMMQALGCTDARDLLLKENLFEIWSALRFVESRSWMNEVFLPSFRELTAADFEERAIRLFVLPKKWIEISSGSDQFVKKKYHNVSHLKEMGVIFIVPIEADTKGLMLRVFMLLLHYLHEVPFYSRLFRQAQTSGNFAAEMISYLRGDVREVKELTDNRQFLIVQRYLAKENREDPRILTPHVNPEALHWRGAENDLARFARNISNPIIEVWHDLDWVGGFFGGTFIPFNLIDALMSMISRDGGNGVDHAEIKYRYHHQEALWNKIFFEYLGEDRVKDIIVAHLRDGYGAF